MQTVYMGSNLLLAFLVCAALVVAPAYASAQEDGGDPVTKADASDESASDDEQEDQKDRDELTPEERAKRKAEHRRKLLEKVRKQNEDLFEGAEISDNSRTDFVSGGASTESGVELDRAAPAEIDGNEAFNSSREHSLAVYNQLSGLDDHLKRMCFEPAARGGDATLDGEGQFSVEFRVVGDSAPRDVRVDGDSLPDDVKTCVVEQVESSTFSVPDDGEISVEIAYKFSVQTASDE